jgi:hypothetical protein
MFNFCSRWQLFFDSFMCSLTILNTTNNLLLKCIFSKEYPLIGVHIPAKNTPSLECIFSNEWKAISPHVKEELRYKPSEKWIRKVETWSTWLIRHPVTGFGNFQTSNSKFVDFDPIPNLLDEIRRTSSRI